MRSDFAAFAVDGAFAAVGIPGCSYQPPAGMPVDGITCMLIAPDRDAQVGDLRARVGTIRIDVRASDVAEPVKGGVFTVEGRSYRILSVPERADARQMIWRCEAAAV